MTPGKRALDLIVASLLLLLLWPVILLVAAVLRVREGAPVLYVSYENPAADFVRKHLLRLAGLSGADVLRGQQQEFYAIIAVVIGGTLLTGGYGSAIGAALGALIFGMVRQGIVYAGVDADWFQVFLGGMLLIAVLINRFVRNRAMESRR